MPRKPRLTVPGALHHIMAHSIEKQSLFNDDEDRTRFLTFLNEGIKKTGFKCYAWALMNNHYHLLLRTNEHPLSFLMRPLNAKYAGWFRKKDGSRGYLFQDRFKSIVTQEQGYVEELIRYIHLNPLRAGICKNLKELDRYPWCGHAVYMGYKHNTFQDTRDVLKRFGRNRLGAIKKYRDFLEAAIGQDQKDDLMDAIRKNNVDRVDRHDHRCWVIGDQEFVKTALAHEKAKRLQVALHSSKGLTIESVVEQVASQMKMDVSEVMIRGRKNKRSMLRKVSAALAHRAGGIPLVEIARYFGVGGSSISRMLDEGDGYAAENNVILKH